MRSPQTFSSHKNKMLTKNRPVQPIHEINLYYFTFYFDICKLLKLSETQY